MTDEHDLYDERIWREYSSNIHSVMLDLTRLEMHQILQALMFARSEYRNPCPNLKQERDDEIKKTISVVLQQIEDKEAMLFDKIGGFDRDLE